MIFSERKLLPEPDVKIVTRSVFYDETGKRVRTKKEITDENGQVRKGCAIIKKGDVYESHLFTAKDERFKREAFIAKAKEVYTELINSHISDPEQRLKVFDRNSVYLPTKKIGKSNPKAAEIEADQYRKAVEVQIQQLEQEIRQRLDALPTILEEDGYPDVQAFTATYRKAEKIVSQYNRDLAEWERIVQEKKWPAERPPEKQSVREQLRRFQEEGRKKPKHKNRDYER